MRIGIDIRALMEGRTTGVQIYIINLLHALFRLDRDNRYLLFANSRRDISGLLPEFPYANVELRLFRYPNKLFNLAQKYLRWPKVDRLLGGLDLFFSPHWRVTALTATVPLLLTFHDLSFEIMPNFFTIRQRLWHRLQNLRQAARAAWRIVAVSQSTKHDLVNLYGTPARKIQVIYPGVPEAQPETFIADLPPRYFLAFGTFEPRKNLEAALAAYEEYFRTAAAPLPLVLAGSPGWKAELKIPAHLQNSVKIFQSVSEGQKTHLYRHAFALIFLSFYEGFGFPVLEAAAAGVPVICGFGTSLSEVGQDFALFANPLRPNQAAAAMSELARDRQFYKKLQEAGRRAAAKFTWDGCARHVLNLFQGLVN